MSLYFPRRQQPRGWYLVKGMKAPSCRPPTSSILLEEPRSTHLLYSSPLWFFFPHSLQSLFLLVPLYSLFFVFSHSYVNNKTSRSLSLTFSTSPLSTSESNLSRKSSYPSGYSSSFLWLERDILWDVRPDGHQTIKIVFRPFPPGLNGRFSGVMVVKGDFTFFFYVLFLLFFSFLYPNPSRIGRAPFPIDPRDVGWNQQRHCYWRGYLPCLPVSLGALSSLFGSYSRDRDEPVLDSKERMIVSDSRKDCTVSALLLRVLQEIGVRIPEQTSL